MSAVCRACGGPLKGLCIGWSRWYDYDGAYRDNGSRPEGENAERSGAVEGEARQSGPQSGHRPYQVCKLLDVEEG